MFIAPLLCLRSDSILNFAAFVPVALDELTVVRFFSNESCVEIFLVNYLA